MSPNAPMNDPSNATTSAEKIVAIVNRLGLHARAAAKLVTLAAKYQADIKVAKDGKQVSGKSIMGVMMLAAGIGTDVEVECDGDREEEALKALVALINDKFGEGE